MKNELLVDLTYRDCRVSVRVNGVIDRSAGCSGGGYDMTGKCIGNVLTAYTNIIDEIKKQDNETFKHDNYGYSSYNGRYYIDGACGTDSMIRIARNCNIDVKQLANTRNTRQYLITYEDFIPTGNSFNSIDEIKARHIGIYNGHFFDDDTMRFFNSYIYPKVYGGCYFITSEKRDYNDNPEFTIRKADVNGSIETIGDFGQYNSLETARYEVKKLVKAGI